MTLIDLSAEIDAVIETENLSLRVILLIDLLNQERVKLEANQELLLVVQKDLTRTEAFWYSTKAALAKARAKNTILAGEFKLFKAVHQSVTCIRPIVEMKLLQWYQERWSDGPTISLDEINNKFVGLLSGSQESEDQHDKAMLYKAITRASELSGYDEKDIERKLPKIWSIVCREPRISISEDVEVPNRIGVLVSNKDKLFSAAMGAFFIFHNVSHTATKYGYIKEFFSFNAELESIWLYYDVDDYDYDDEEEEEEEINE